MNTGPFTDTGSDVEAAIADFDTFAHAVDAEPAQGVLRSHDTFPVEPAAVVGDGQFEVPIDQNQRDTDILGLAAVLRASCMTRYTTIFIASGMSASLTSNRGVMRLPW